MHAPADWQLPPGVSRAVWDYLHDSSLAAGYDESLAGTPLLDLDRRFVDEYCPKPCRVIDLGCGTGRVSIPLAERGHRVTAVDLSEPMLREAGRKAEAAGVALHRVRANIVTLGAICNETFDTALCLFSTLGMVAGAEARGRVVAEAFRLLRPGGLFLLHAHGRWHHLRTAAGRRWLAADVGRRLRGRPDAGDWRMDHHAGTTGWAMHLFTRRELVRLLRAAGFAVLEVRPVGLGASARLRWPWLLGGWRAYGFLVAARRPGSDRPNVRL